MNKIYTLALSSGLLLFAVPTFAQYTAVRAGDWHASIPANSIWLGAEPPTSCAHCTITLAVVGGGTINLNRHVVLTANTQVTVGDGTDATVVDIANSGHADTSLANSINLINDNSNSAIKVLNGSSVIVEPNVSNAGDFDGIFVSAVTTSGGSTVVSAVKEVGFSPNLIVNNGVSLNGPVGTSTMSGGNTLSSSGPLPIILANFGATLNEGVVDLSWTTSLEINSDHFAILRSANAGADWEVIGTVPAHGNSSVSVNYSFADGKPVQGTAEYRLRMVDRDGAYKYSEVKTIRTGAVTSVSVYPNPARDFVNVTLGNASGFTLIRLYNQGGQLLQEKSLNNPGGTIVPLAVSSYPEGNYIVVVTGADGWRTSSKVLITK